MTPVPSNSPQHPASENVRQVEAVKFANGGCPNPDCPLAKPAGGATGEERHRYRHLERVLRHQMRRFDLRHREQTLAELILEWSYGWGIPNVRVPKLDVFVDATGISRGNVHNTLESLYQMGIVTVIQREGGIEYAINPNVNEWRCRPRVSVSQVRRAVDMVKAVNGLDREHEETPKNFKDGAKTHFLGAVVSDAETVSDWDQPFPKLD